MIINDNDNDNDRTDGRRGTTISKHKYLVITWTRHGKRVSQLSLSPVVSCVLV